MIADRHEQLFLIQVLWRLIVATDGGGDTFFLRPLIVADDTLTVGFFGTEWDQLNQGDERAILSSLHNYAELKSIQRVAFRKMTLGTSAMIASRERRRARVDAAFARAADDCSRAVYSAINDEDD